jgi:uncharacterized membrane protein YeaQ/YmgE (transglycosylase-associated protein family)
MEIVFVIGGMIVVGLIMGVLAGVIWKEGRPLGVPGDYLVAVLTSVIVGLGDWYVIPAMGFSTTLRNIGIATEPALSALIVLWLIKRARG